MSKKIIGELFMTCGINNTIAENRGFAKEVWQCLQRFGARDWGELSEEDIETNNMAYESGKERLFASYQTCEGKIWIITEGDRSYTTILFPSEY